MLYLTAVSMLFQHSILHVLIQTVSVAFCFAILMLLNNSHMVGFRSHLTNVFKLLAFAIPFAVALFMFFPRIAPLWSLPFTTSNASTGMNDVMEPGSIAELSQSSERAFRATFSDDLVEIPRSQLYWRGVVLDQFDGRTWRRASDALNVERLHAGVLNKNIVEPYEPKSLDKGFYDVIAEPHNNRWAFALDRSVPASTNIHSVGSGVVEFTTNIASPTPYRLEFDSGVPTTELAFGVQTVEGVARVSSHAAQDLQLPVTGNAKTRALVGGWLAQGPTELELVFAVQQYFQNEGFVYTLRPPVLGVDSIDEFLFQARRGFCEHYASAMAFMFREAGMRARVILGYMGGEYKSSQNYWLVRQYDAHAWVEVYVTGVGWLRVDPTAVIAPDRISSGLEQAVDYEGSFLADGGFSSLAYDIAALKWLVGQADAINYQWQRYVLRYDGRSQRALFDRIFGGYSLARLLWWLVGTLSVIAGLFAMMIWLGRYQTKLSAQERSYLRYLLILQIFKVRRELGETPLKFYVRVNERLPKYVAQSLKKRTDDLYKNLYNEST